MSGTLQQTIDMHLTDDMDLQGSEVSGGTALAERLFRRLTTPRGFFDFWPNDGYDVRAAVLSKKAPWEIQTNVEDQCLRDEQVSRARCELRTTDFGRKVDVRVYVESDYGTYTFTMGITEAAATLVSLQKNVG